MQIGEIIKSHSYRIIMYIQKRFILIMRNYVKYVFIMNRSEAIQTKSTEY